MDNGLGAELESEQWRQSRATELSWRRAGDQPLVETYVDVDQFETGIDVPRIETLIGPELVAHWDDLARRVRSSPYLRPGWIDAWWRAFGCGRLEIRTLERGGRLIALLPLARRHGALRSMTNPHTPEFGMLAEDRAAAFSLTHSLFGSARARRITVCSLDPDGLELDALQRAADKKRCRSSVRFYERSPYLRVDSDWGAYSAALGTGFAAGLRRSHRQLDRLGAASFEIADGRHRLADRLEETFAVESSGWKDACGTAIRAQTQTRRFYTDVARWAVDSGLLRLFFLRLDGRTLAAYFALQQDGVLYLLKGGYDPGHARVSPGKLLMHLVIEHAFKSGVTRIELHGDADAYKLRWCETVRERVTFDGFSRSPFGRLDWSFFRYGRPAARRVFRRSGGVPSPIDHQPDPRTRGTKS